MIAAVLLRAAPDSEAPATSGACLQLDAASVLAIALGLSWKKLCGGELVGIAAGPESWEPALRDALALGIDRASRVHQDKCDLPDIAATAAALVAALPAGAAMVIAGPEASDNGSGALPAAVAGILDLPLMPDVTGLEARVDGVSVEVRAGPGRRATYLLKEPAVLAAARAALPPLYPPLARRFAAARATIPVLEAAGADLAESRARFLGFGPGRPRTRRLLKPDANASAGDRLGMLMSGGARKRDSSTMEGDAASLARQLVDVLAQEGFLPKQANER